MARSNLRYIARKPREVADIPRRNKKKFLNYMFANPYYFQSIWKKEATEKNILVAYKEVNKLSSALTLGEFRGFGDVKIY